MPGKILLVDDSRLARRLIKDDIVAAGYEIAGEAASGREALALFVSLKPEVVIMDFNMPDMNGLEAAKAILREDPGAKIIMVTSLHQPSLQKELMDAGVKAMFGKPCPTQDLVVSLKNLMPAA